MPCKCFKLHVTRPRGRVNPALHYAPAEAFALLTQALESEPLRFFNTVDHAMRKIRSIYKNSDKHPEYADYLHNMPDWPEVEDVLQMEQVLLGRVQAGARKIRRNVPYWASIHEVSGSIESA